MLYDVVVSLLMFALTEMSALPPTKPVDEVVDVDASNGDAMICKIKEMKMQCLFRE